MKLLLVLPAAGLLAAAAACTSMDNTPMNTNLDSRAATEDGSLVANGNPLPGVPQRDGVENPGDDAGGADLPPDSTFDAEPN